MGEPRGGVDCSSGDEGHLFIACSVVRMSALMSRASSTHSTPRCCRSPRVADP